MQKTYEGPIQNGKIHTQGKTDDTKVGMQKWREIKEDAMADDYREKPFYLELGEEIGEEKESDATRIGGKSWKELKENAMKDDYQTKEWFVSTLLSQLE